MGKGYQSFKERILFANFEYSTVSNDAVFSGPIVVSLNAFQSIQYTSTNHNSPMIGNSNVR